MTFQRVLTESGLTKIELAQLYGVSRQTIFHWKEDGLPRPGFTAAGRTAETITRALLAALTRRILPLGAMSKEARRDRVKKMAVTLQNLKPAPVKDVHVHK